MKNVTLYSDGACSGNPGPGGWGCILIYQDTKKILSGYCASATNNQMELTAIIKGLEALKEPCCVEVFSDSAYVTNAFVKGWVKNWIKRGWRKADNSPVLNQDLWQALLKLTQKHQVRFVKVKGHADNELNNRCDQLATNEIKKNRNLSPD